MVERVRKKALELKLINMCANVGDILTVDEKKLDSKTEFRYYIIR